MDEPKKCPRCASMAFLHEHHVFPRKWFGRKDNDELVEMCPNCHDRIHRMLPKEQKSKEWYKSFTARFMQGLLVLGGFIYFLTNLL